MSTYLYFVSFGNRAFCFLILISAVCPLFAQKELLRAGTTLEVSLLKAVDSETANPGAAIELEVSTRVSTSNGKILIKEGLLAQGRVTKVVRAYESRTGEGLVEIEVMTVRAADGTRIYVRGTRLWAKGNYQVNRSWGARIDAGAAISVTIQEDYLIIGF